LEGIFQSRESISTDIGDAVEGKQHNQKKYSGQFDNQINETVKPVKHIHFSSPFAPFSTAGN
jgi:hypothetical protein